MVDHRQHERSTHLALVFSDEEFDESGSYIGGEPLGEVSVRFSSGGSGWVQADSGQRVERDPTLDWPVTDAALAKKGRELHLRHIDEDEPDDPKGEYVIENVNQTYGRYRTLEELTVSVSTV